MNTAIRAIGALLKFLAPWVNETKGQKTGSWISIVVIVLGAAYSVLTTVYTDAPKAEQTISAPADVGNQADASNEPAPTVVQDVVGGVDGGSECSKAIVGHPDASLDATEQ